MKKIDIYKAQKIGEREVESTEILIDKEIPNFENVWEFNGVCEKEAEILESTLCDSLPGAIYDRLLVKMLERKSSQFVVSYKERSES